MADLKDAGAVAVSDDGRCVTNSQVMRRALEYARDVRPAGHPARRGPRAHRGRADARGRGLDAARPPRLAARRRGRHRRARRARSPSTWARATTWRTSRRRAPCASCARRRRAASRVTAEVTPHHLLLTHEALLGYDTACKVNPPLREPEDVDALRARPRRRDDRLHRHRPRAARRPRQGRASSPRPRPGMIGLELCLPLLLGLVRAGRAAARAPRRRADARARRASSGLEPPRIRDGARADLVLVDPRAALDDRPGAAADEEPQHAVRRPRRSRAGRDDDVRRAHRLTKPMRGVHRVTDPTKQDRAWLVARRRHRVRRAPLRRARRDHRRGRLHDDDDRLPGGADRPLVLRADRHDDGAGDRQRRRQRARTPRRSTARRASRASSCATRAPSRRTGAPRSRSTRTSRGTASSASPTSTRASSRATCATTARRTAPSGPTSPEALLRRAREAPDMNGLDLVRAVTPEGAVRLDRGARRLGDVGAARARPSTTSSSSTSASSATSCAAWSTPAAGSRSSRATSTADEVLALQPDGIFLSNGPGDPAAVDLRRRHRPRPRSARSPSSASASATSSSRSRSAPRPTSSSSATAAPTSR